MTGIREVRTAALRELMANRRRQGRAAAAWPIDPWRLVTTVYAPERLPQAETLFAVANGYLGLRGAPDEGKPAFDPGVLLNGFYETWPIPYGERAFGFATTGQTIVTATDGTVIRLYVDEEPVDLSQVPLRTYEQVLDMRCGFAERTVVWETPRGAFIALRSRRLASLDQRHLAVIDYEVTVLEGRADLAISSELVTHPLHEASDDPRRGGHLEGAILVPVDAWDEKGRVVLELVTRASGMGMACGMEHRLETTSRYTTDTAAEDGNGRVVFLIDAQTGVPIRMTKYLAYHHAGERFGAICSGACIARSTGPAMTDSPASRRFSGSGSTPSGR